MTQVIVLDEAAKAQEALLKIADKTENKTLKRRWLKYAIRVGKLARGSTKETSE
jgi:hypothetical protein